LTFKLQEPTT